MGRDLVEKNKFTKNLKGNLTKRDNVLNDQIKHDIKYVDIKNIKKFKPKILFLTLKSSILLFTLQMSI